MDSKREPDLFSYIVKSDSGFAPNSYGQLCTLACCKPRIRMSANIGDWVIGTTPSPHPGKLVFAMEVLGRTQFCSAAGGMRILFFRETLQGEKALRERIMVGRYEEEVGSGWTKRFSGGFVKCI